MNLSTILNIKEVRIMDQYELQLAKNAMPQIMDIVAEKIIVHTQLYREDEELASNVVKERTGSEYLAGKSFEDFGHRFLNSDNKHKELLMRFLGINASILDVECMRMLMMYFYNNSLDVFTNRFKVDPFGCSENWCKLWILLNQIEKLLLVDTILKWKG